MRIEYMTQQVPHGVQAAIDFCAEDEREEQILTDYRTDSERHPDLTFIVLERKGPRVTRAMAFMLFQRILSKQEFEDSFKRIKRVFRAQGWAQKTA